MGPRCRYVRVGVCASALQWCLCASAGLSTGGDGDPVLGVCLSAYADLCGVVCVCHCFSAEVMSVWVTMLRHL